MVSLAGLLAACSGNQALENRFAANPALQSSPTTPSPTPTPDTPPTPEPEPSPSPETTPSGSFSDLGDLPTAQVQQIEDLAQLGLLTPKTEQQFAPQQPVSRGEFAHWLFQANNLFFADQPSKQIRAASSNASAVFTDVPATHPYFGEIQGLADAGLIPSSLTNEPSTTSFRPDAPLTREELLLWKVPLDLRTALPRASLDNIKDTWGFQDAGKINPKTWPALMADFQNGDRANVRRMLGYTTIFQPQRGVTRAEAAVSLWFLGSQNDGLSAEEVLGRSPTEETGPQGEEQPATPAP